MDPAAFDDALRTLGKAVTRRGALAGALAGLAGGTVAVAKRKPCPPPRMRCGNRCVDTGKDERNCGACGRRCRSNETCTVFGCALRLGEACTANDRCLYDGDIAICFDNGNASDGPLNCCHLAGGRCAVDGHCCRDVSCTAGICGGQDALRPLGSPCTSAAQCASGVCADNGISRDGPLNCCTTFGLCGSDAECCASRFCINGVCRAI